MTSETLRVSGAVVSALVIAAALYVALRLEEPLARTLLPAPVPQMGAVAAPTPLAFAVRFRGDGPIARAQALAAAGSERRASRRVPAELRRQAAFDGLCFEGFTRRAAEIILKPCGDVADAERAEFQTRWLASLNRMGAVEYANLAPDTRER